MVPGSPPFLQASESSSRQRDASLRDRRLKMELTGVSSAQGAQSLDLSSFGTDALCAQVATAVASLQQWSSQPVEAWTEQLQLLGALLATGESGRGGATVPHATRSVAA